MRAWLKMEAEKGGIELNLDEWTDYDEDATIPMQVEASLTVLCLFLYHCTPLSLCLSASLHFCLSVSLPLAAYLSVSIYVSAYFYNHADMFLSHTQTPPLQIPNLFRFVGNKTITTAVSLR